MSAYIDHMAFRVKDFEGYLTFFQDVFDMEVTLSMGEKPNRKIWLGGIQLNEDIHFEGPEGRSDHVGIRVDDIHEVLEKAKKYNVKTMPQGENWIQLEEGLCIELVEK